MWKRRTKQPSCTEGGSKSIHCKNCDETKNVTSIPATGHTYEDGVCTACGEKETPILRGDINKDGVINSKDYLLLKRYCLGTFKLSAEQLAVADVNGDGRINGTDYLLVKRAALGMFVIV